VAAAVAAAIRVVAVAWVAVALTVWVAVAWAVAAWVASADTPGVANHVAAAMAWVPALEATRPLLA
jgi:hypothetical protein